MANFFEDLKEDIDEVFLNEEEFAISATLLCEYASKETKIIFNLDPEIIFNNEFSTLYKEDDGSGIVKVYVSRDEVKRVEI